MNSHIYISIYMKTSLFSETVQNHSRSDGSAPCKYVLLMIRWLCFLSDIDECETQQAHCAHGCHNTLGSFACVCLTAYELGSDGKQCYSESTTLYTHYHCTILTTSQQG